MSAEARPTAREKADAADEVVAAIERAHHEIFEARRLIRVLHDDKHFLGLIDKNMLHLLEKCDEPLWAARKIAVVEAYDERRKAERETADADR